MAYRLEKVLEGISAREGSSRFDIEDVEAIRKAIETAVWQRFSVLGGRIIMLYP